MTFISLATLAAAFTAISLQLNAAGCSPQGHHESSTGTEARTMLATRTKNVGRPTNQTYKGITSAEESQGLGLRRAGHRNLRERERPHIGGQPVSISGGDGGVRIEFPRVYSAKIRGHKRGVSYTREELAEDFFAMEVDALDVLETDLPASPDEFDQASREGLGPTDFARISFLVTNVEELERLEAFATAHQGRVSSRSHASEIRFEPAITEKFLAANGIDAGGRRGDDKGKGRPGPGDIRPNARKMRTTYSTIPGYSCYRNLAGTYDFLDDLNQTSVPGLSIDVSDIGDSYFKSDNQGGYDILALKLTGDNGGTATNTKGIFFAMCGIHAREYATVEACAQFAEMLIEDYGNDAGITALLDHTEIHMVLQANPDGRVRAETGELHRKNRNPSYSTSCTGNNVGVDLNRNFRFKWGLNSGSSSNPCSATYRGPSPESEPETQAIRDYVEALFPQGQRKSDPEGGDIDAAYDDGTTTGIFFDVHSYGEINIWPWGWIEQPNANDDGLQALARKMRSINGYELAGPLQSGWIYEVSGSTTDYAYGELGASSATLELGQSFFQPCGYFESDIVDRTKGALLYAASVSKLPYSIVKGPEITGLSYTVDEVAMTITVTADVSDIAMLLEGSETTYPTGTQNIASVKLYIDEHPEDATMPAPVAIDMTASDGAYDEVTETVVATANWAMTGNRHVLHVQARDSDGYAGPIRSAYFLESPTPSPTMAPTAPIITASYDSALGAPYCDEVASACDASSSMGIVNGRGTVGPEPNQPNTIDSCTDGTSGSYLSDESIEGLFVRSLDGELMREGSSAEIVVEAYAWSTGSQDSADFYHAADAANPSWVFIATQPAGAGGSVTLTQSFTLASGSAPQAVRVNFRYQGSASPCSTGNYDDRDDLVFTVAPSGCTTSSDCPSQETCLNSACVATPSPTTSPTSTPSVMPSESSEPSMDPSSVPSHVPSSAPSGRPSGAVSSVPSAEPSVSPSAFPSFVPTESTLPSAVPSPGPSMEGTNEPSVSPSGHPSSMPSALPSDSFMPSLGTPTWYVLSFDSFETSYGSWTDGGSDATRVSAGASDGSISVRLRDDTSTSRITSSSNLVVGEYDELRVAFSFIAESMETNEALFLQISTDGGSSFSTVKTWRRDATDPSETDFSNGIRYNEEVIIDSNEIPLTDTTRLRFQLDGSSDGDNVYLDEVEVAASPAPAPLPAASYDVNLFAPACTSNGIGCDTVDLIVGRGASMGPNGEEPNNPNTIGSSCADGTDGGNNYLNWESIERITVQSVEANTMQGGSEVLVEAEVWAWSNGDQDAADFYYTENAQASSINWIYLGTVVPPGGGLQVLSQQYSLPQVIGMQAVRVNFRWQENASTCTGGQYADTDDLAFAVA